MKQFAALPGKELKAVLADILSQGSDALQVKRRLYFISELEQIVHKDDGQQTTDYNVITSSIVHRPWSFPYPLLYNQVHFCNRSSAASFNWPGTRRQAQLF